MPLDSLTERQALAVEFGNDALFAFICTATPGTTDAVNNEASGGTPIPYARQPISWSAPDANAIITATVTFVLPPGTYTYFGCAGAVTGANRKASGLLSQQLVYTQPTTFSLALSYQQQ